MEQKTGKSGTEQQSSDRSVTKEELRLRQTQRRTQIEKRKKGRRLILGAGTLAVMLLLAGVLMSCRKKDSSGENTDPSILQGVWRYDEWTVYEFDGRGKGCLCLEDTVDYEFHYSVEGSLLRLDYVPDYVQDCEYTFRLEAGSLILTGGSGTAEPGRIYELTRRKK